MIGEIQFPQGGLVMVRDGHRVELHCVTVEPDCHYAVALSGGGDRPQRDHCQGPLTRAELAEAAARAIATQLERIGYAVVEERPRWQLPAWRRRRDIADARRGNAVDPTFREEDVWPWPGK